MIRAMVSCVVSGMLAGVVVLGPAFVPGVAVARAGVGSPPELVPFTGSHRIGATWGAPSNGYHPYPAVDIGMDVGTAIYAAGAAVVLATRSDDRRCDPTQHVTSPGDLMSGIDWCKNNGFANAGTWIRLRHADGTDSLYGHLSTIVAGVTPGATVSAGQQIAWSGDSGITTGPHLHYEEQNSAGVPIDPGTWMSCHGGSRTDYTDVQHLFRQTVRNDDYACIDLTGNSPYTASSPSPSSSHEFAPLVPTRLLESRTGLSTGDGLSNGIGVRPAGSVTEVPVAGRAGVPSGASAVVLNITVTGPQADGFVTVFPCGSQRPNAANLNYAAGETIPNMVIAKVGDGGKVCIFTLATTDIVVDIGGYFPAGSTYTPLVPSRLLETRAGLSTGDGLFNGIGVRSAGSVTELKVTGRAGVTSGASAVVLNITVTGPQADGFVTVFPCGSQRPTAANLNYIAGETIPNAAIAKVGDGGKVCIFTLSATDIVVDIGGYFPAGSIYSPLVPVRLSETRAGLSTGDGLSNGIGARPAGSVTYMQVAGRGGVPADAVAVVLNIAVTGPLADGFVTVFPCGSSRPNAASLNYAAVQTIPNAVIAKVGDGGKVCIFTLATTEIVVDVGGYFPG